jgi:hypothetical protein
MGPDVAFACQDDIADVLNQALAADAQAKAALQGLTAQATDSHRPPVIRP